MCGVKSERARTHVVFAGEIVHGPRDDNETENGRPRGAVRPAKLQIRVFALFCVSG
jgi:hypothetical protein